MQAQTVSSALTPVTHTCVIVTDAYMHMFVCIVCCAYLTDKNNVLPAQSMRNGNGQIKQFAFLFLSISLSASSAGSSSSPRIAYVRSFVCSVQQNAGIFNFSLLPASPLLLFGYTLPSSFVEPDINNLIIFDSQQRLSCLFI